MAAAKSAERRRAPHRDWPLAEKRRLVELTLRPGVSVGAIAREHGLNPTSLSHWRSLYRSGKLEMQQSASMPRIDPPAASATFLPVSLVRAVRKPQQTTRTNARIYLRQQGDKAWSAVKNRRSSLEGGTSDAGADRPIVQKETLDAEFPNVIASRKMTMKIISTLRLIRNLGSAVQAFGSRKPQGDSKGTVYGRSWSTVGSPGSGTGHGSLSVSGAGSVPVPAIHLPPLPAAAGSARADPSLIAAWRQAHYHGNLRYEELALPDLLRSADRSLRLPTTQTGEPIVAYRVWRVFRLDRGEAPSELRMASAHYGKVVWEPGVPMAGVIDPARPQRRAGIHAYSDASRMISGSVRPCLQGRELTVAGTVSLWGEVIVYEHGYRAQFAYPRQLCWTSGDPQLLQELATIYGCEVYVPAIETSEAA